MMNLQHRVRVNLVNHGRRKRLVECSKLRLPKRLLNLIFGEFCEVMVLTPGTTVRDVEIHEVQEDEYDDYDECDDYDEYDEEDEDYDDYDEDDEFPSDAD